MENYPVKHAMGEELVKILRNEMDYYYDAEIGAFIF